MSATFEIRRWCFLGTAVLCAAFCSLSASCLALPNGRVYEQVTPTYKAGYGANSILAASPDGDSVAFSSIGSFAGDPSNDGLSNAYMAHRANSGWQTTSLQIPTAIVPTANIVDFSATLDASLADGKPGPNGGIASYDGTDFDYLLRNTLAPDTASSIEVAGMTLKTLTNTPFKPLYFGASSDFSHVVLEDREQAQLLPEAVSPGLYDLTTGALGGTPAVRLIGVNNKNKLFESQCLTLLGSPSGKQSPLNAVSADGNEIFVTMGITGDCGAHQQLFVRIGDSKTLEVSRPLSSECVEVPCKGVEELDPNRGPTEFQGANEAGTKVFFTTTQQLVSTDKDEGNDLYMASIGCSGGEQTCEPTAMKILSLTQVSHGAQAADVEGVVSVAPDGSTVYFVAQGVLSGAPNAQGRVPTAGADNLYEYDTASGGPPHFVADLCSGPATSGVVEDVKCPADLSVGQSETNDTGLWRTAQPSAQTAGQGRFLVFASFGQLTVGDTDTAKDVYRYDRETGSLTRVSIGEAGHDANGNADSFDATIPQTELFDPMYEQHGLGSRVISEDGSKVVFVSAEPLSVSAVNGLANVYEWRESASRDEGEVSLISSGASDEADEQVVMSPSGDDVFFKTVAGLVAQDNDGAADIYDARVNGGFPPESAQRQPCSGDACQGALSNPAPLLVPGSVSQASGGNYSSPVTKSKKVSLGTKKRKAKHARRKARAGAATKKWRRS